MILIDKPAGMSSFGVVAKVRGRLKAELGHKVKVGHTGTLDPFATGLLILLSGKMTKKSGEFLKLDKEYVATLKLGFTSTTGDIEGEIQSYSNEGDASDKIQSHLISDTGRKIQSCSTRGASDKIQSHLISDTGRSRPSLRGSRPNSRPWPPKCPQSSVIESAVKSFVGVIEQTPPKYSAIKINGERAYKLARKGQDFEVPSRKVEIYNIEILKYEYPELTIRCEVSSGTYIRTLAEDIGKKLGVGAYLTELRRTKVGKYDVKDAVKLEDFV